MSESEIEHVKDETQVLIRKVHNNERLLKLIEEYYQNKEKLRNLKNKLDKQRDQALLIEVEKLHDKIKQKQKTLNEMKKIISDSTTSLESASSYSSFDRELSQQMITEISQKIGNKIAQVVKTRVSNQIEDEFSREINKIVEIENNQKININQQLNKIVDKEVFQKIGQHATEEINIELNGVFNNKLNYHVCENENQKIEEKNEQKISTRSENGLINNDVNIDHELDKRLSNIIGSK